MATIATTGRHPTPVTCPSFGSTQGLVGPQCSPSSASRFLFALSLSTAIVTKVVALKASQSGTAQFTESKVRPHSEIKKIRDDILQRQRTAVDVMEEYLVRLKKCEPSVKSFLHIAEESALKAAAEVDKSLAQGQKLGPLAGVPISIKDNLCTMDMPSTGGSKSLNGYQPPYDATAVSRLRDAGAVLVGKTNMDEFGMGSSTEGSAFQVTSNPWDLTRVPGGSSGGSAAAVAARQCAAALGSDTGGSIRQPASFCGIVGLKPSYGRVSRFGLMAYASSLDVVGCLGTSVLDTATLLGVIAGKDEKDATSSIKEVSDYGAQLQPPEFLESKPLAGLRCGLIKETMHDSVDAGVASSVQSAALHLEQLGATINEISLSRFSLGLPAYYILAPSEASSNLARYDGARYGPRAEADELSSMYGASRGQGFGLEVKRRILTGTYALSAGYYDAFYKRAQQVRTLIKTDMEAALKENDILLSPVSPTAAFKIGEKSTDPLSMYMGDIMTVNVNLAGLPALVVPCGFVDGEMGRLPVGLQIVGNAFEEDKLLFVGHIFEQTLNFDFVAPSF